MQKNIRNTEVEVEIFLRTIMEKQFLNQCAFVIFPVESELLCNNSVDYVVLKMYCISRIGKTIWCTSNIFPVRIKAHITITISTATGCSMNNNINKFYVVFEFDNNSAVILSITYFRMVHIITPVQSIKHCVICSISRSITIN